MVSGIGGSGGFNLGNASGTVQIDASGVRAGMQQAKQAFDTGTRNMGDGLKSLGGNVTQLGASFAALSLPITGFIAAGVRTASAFDSAMAEISARTGLVGDELEKVRQQALEMGKTTVFSAQQSADAFLQLLSSGQSAEEAIATLPTVLTAAAASGEDLGHTADLVTDIMAAFNLEIDQAESVVNSLARASASSSADMASLGQGFANVGPVARQFGLDVDQTSAVLAIFAENGIKGAEAGTQLRSMLLNMSRNTGEVKGAWNELGVSLYDAEGNIRNINTVMEELRQSLQGMPLEQQNRLMRELGGSYGIMGLTALTTGMSIDEMQQRMSEQASAADIADKRMKTFEGTVLQLKAAFEAFMIEVLKPFMDDVLAPILQQVTQLITTFTRWATENKSLAQGVLILGAALGAVGAALVPIGLGISAIGNAIAAYNAIAKAFTAVNTAMNVSISMTGIASAAAAAGVWVLNAALAVLTSPITLLIASIGLLILVWKEWGAEATAAAQQLIIIFAEKAPEAFEAFKQKAGQILSSILSGIKNNFINPVVNFFTQRIPQAINGLFSPFQKFGQFVMDVVGSIMQALSDLVGTFNDVKEAIGDIDIGKGIKAVGNKIGDALGFADGGRPPVNRPSIVGENGPELFVPDRGGEIFSNPDTRRMLAGAGGGNQNITLAPVLNIGDIGGYSPQQIEDFTFNALNKLLDQINNG